ncbi:MAG: peptidase M20, partial [Anaerolineae bacterium CG06_land_8_20_14_3_00_57_67]
MSDQRTAALKYARQNKAQSLKLLETFLRIPSISTESANQPDMQRAADWVAAQLSGLGMQNVEIYPTARHPVVYAEW